MHDNSGALAFTDRGKRMEEQTQSGDDPPFDGNTTQPMEAQKFNVDTQPNQNSG